MNVQLRDTFQPILSNFNHEEKEFKSTLKYLINNCLLNKNEIDEYNENIRSKDFCKLSELKGIKKISDEIRLKLNKYEHIWDRDDNKVSLKTLENMVQAQNEGIARLNDELSGTPMNDKEQILANGQAKINQLKLKIDKARQIQENEEKIVKHKDMLEQHNEIESLKLAIDLQKEDEGMQLFEKFDQNEENIAIIKRQDDEIKSLKLAIELQNNDLKELQ